MGAACCSDVSPAPPLPPVSAEVAPAGANTFAPVAAQQQAQAPPPPAGTMPVAPAAVPPAQQTFSAPPAVDAVKPDKDGGASSRTGSSMSDDQLDCIAAKEQKAQAKALVKDFVKKMVKGEKLNVMTQTGQLKTCTVSLSRGLDTLKIKLGAQERKIKLTDIEEILVGTDVNNNVTTPVDELCATLMLATEDCITFRMGDVNSRDTFVMCLLMFCNSQQ